MKLLLDTHALIWAVRSPDRLSARVVKMLSGDAELFVSAASLWEIVIKVGLKKLELGAPPETVFPLILDALHARLLPIALDHLYELSRLPRLHGDPFDRLLIAQAMTEQLPIVTMDQEFARYPVPVVW
ncbi:MAG: type II toxin-antitoxin system VapC family toxin [Bryobacteraceae bacterium]